MMLTSPKVARNEIVTRHLFSAANSATTLKAACFT